MVFSIVCFHELPSAICHSFLKKLTFVIPLKTSKAFLKIPSSFRKSPCAFFPNQHLHFPQKRNVLRHDYPKYHKEYFVI